MKFIICILLAITCQNLLHAQTALSSGFTYQGNLTFNGVPIDGSYDFDLYLFDASISGNQVGQLIVEDIDVDMGFFSVELDFGDGPFTGNQIWMEVRIREGASVGGFQQLLPRQKINSTPYAIHAQFVGTDAIGSLEIQDASITTTKLADDSVTSEKINNGAVSSDDLADDAVVTSKIADNTILSDDLSNNAVTTDKLNNDAVTQTKIADNSVGSDQVISTEVQLRISGGCTQGQYVSAIGEDGSILCVDAIDSSARGVCKTTAGDSGIIINNVCVLSYSNQTSTNWSTAVNTCSALGGDLCSTSQYQAIRNITGLSNPDVFYSNHAVWSNDFSDNDGNSKFIALRSSDDSVNSQQYSYACCGNVLPEPVRSAATIINGVNTTYIHTQQDTTWTAASNICTSLSSDLCTKAQYVALNDAITFSPTASKATAEMSDNDGNSFNAVVGSGSSDNPNALASFAYACCGMSTKPVDLSCPGTVTANGVCIGTIHDTEDTNFFNAARACHNEGANLCSKSQMQAIRTVGQFLGECWTNDGADNDSARAGGLLSSQPDNPDPTTDLFGYACCY